MTQRWKRSMPMVRITNEEFLRGFFSRRISYVTDSMHFIVGDTIKPLDPSGCSYGIGERIKVTDIEVAKTKVRVHFQKLQTGTSSL